MFRPDWMRVAVFFAPFDNVQGFVPQFFNDPRPVKDIGDKGIPYSRHTPNAPDRCNGVYFNRFFLSGGGR